MTKYTQVDKDILSILSTQKRSHFGVWASSTVKTIFDITTARLP